MSKHTPGPWEAIQRHACGTGTEDEMSGLDFDPRTHTYRLAGQRLPSVTQIIDAILPLWKVDDWYLQRGIAVHHGARLLDAGVLDWSSVDAEIEPRIRAWQKFRQDFPAEIIAMEKPLAHAKLRYAGTMDRLLLRDGRYVLADLKNTISQQVRLQLAGYSLLWTVNGGGIVQAAVAVELDESGTYSCLWLNKHELRRAEQQWLALLTVYNFANEHSLLRKS